LWYPIRMSDYRRYFVAGGTFFFTVVTERRAPIFTDLPARQILRRAMRRCFRRLPVDVVAIVLLPDHLHVLWTLPGDIAYSLRWRWIKREFTREWLSLGGAEQARRPSRLRERRRGVWQRRFWEHTIRDESDFEAHFDYIPLQPSQARLGSPTARLAMVEFSSLGTVGALPHGLGRRSKPSRVARRKRRVMVWRRRLSGVRQARGA
jgi:putative transposase